MATALKLQWKPTNDPYPIYKDQLDAEINVLRLNRKPTKYSVAYVPYDKKYKVNLWIGNTGLNMPSKGFDSLDEACNYCQEHYQSIIDENIINGEK